jgi:hypothetical protein
MGKTALTAFVVRSILGFPRPLHVPFQVSIGTSIKRSPIEPARPYSYPHEFIEDKAYHFL